LKVLKLKETEPKVLNIEAVCQKNLFYQNKNIQGIFKKPKNNGKMKRRNKNNKLSKKNDLNLI